MTREMMKLINKVLKDTELQSYLDSFIENDIDDATLLDLDTDDLKELGLSLGHRKKLLKAIGALREDSEAVPASGSEKASEHDLTEPKSEPLLLSEKDLDGERRHLTIVFCDLVGSTALSGRHDPEDLRSILSSYHETVAKEVSRFGGHIAKFLGDGAMIYFGYPKAHENDAERAVRFGLAMQNSVSEMKLEFNEKLNARVGIASGHVVIGHLIGGGISQEHTVTGETPNLAARLESVAGINEVIISSNTKQLVGDFFELEELEPVLLKGFNKAVKAWKAVKEKAVSNRFRAMRGEQTGKMFGRDDELLLLKMGWKKSTNGRGQGYIVFGDPGIGKSHLTESLLEEVKSEGAEIVHLYCSPHHEDSALYPIIQYFNQAIEISELSKNDDRLNTVTAYLKEFSLYSDENLTLLASLLSIDFSTAVADPGFTPGIQKEKTLALLVNYFTSIAEKSPILVVAEDLHWIDPTTDGLLGAVSEAAQNLTMMLLCTTRPNYTPSWPSYPSAVTTLALQRLPLDSVTEIILRVTNGKSLPELIVKQIAEKADGIPIFVEELTRSVLNMGTIEERDGTYVMVKSVQDIGVPATLHDALISRLENSPQIKQTAQVGAVIGREFDPELHSAVSQMSLIDTQSALAELITSGILYKRGTKYVFKHALVQDAIYQSLLNNQRQLYHGRVADILERDFKQLESLEPEIFAYHNDIGGRFEKTHHYLMQAGGLAMSKAAVQEALNFCRRALELIELQQDSPEVRSMKVMTLLAQGQATVVAMGPGSSELLEIVERAAKLCEELGPSTELFAVFVFSAWVRLVRGNYSDVAKYADFAFENAPSPEPQMVVTGTLRGGAEFFQGHLDEAMTCFETVIKQYDFESHKELAKVFDGTDPSQAPLSWGSIVLWMKGKISESNERYQKALEHADAINHKPNTATAWGWASFQSVVRMDADRALEAGAKTKKLGVELGFPFREAEGLIAHGWAIARTEDTKKGIEELSRGIDLWRATGGEVARPLWLSLLSDAHLLEDNPTSAMASMNEAFELIKSTNENIWFAELQRRKAKIFIHLNQTSDAIGLLKQAIQSASDSGYLMIELLSRVDLIELGNSINQCPDHWLTDLRLCFDKFGSDCQMPEMESCRKLLAM